MDVNSYYFFCFKQKTAYEMRISDWSSDVCSSDLVKKLDMFEFIEHIFPKNVIAAMSENNVLQILVFALFAGVGLTALGEKGRPLVRGAEALPELMLHITCYVLRLAPLAVFGALAKVENGSASCRDSVCQCV